MSEKPAILIMQRHLAPLTAFLESAYTVHRFWEGPPVEAAQAISALVVAGEFELDKHLIENLPNLGLIACFTSGYDGIDVAWARARGLQVTHAPGVNHEDVADHALGLILGSRREIVTAGPSLLPTSGVTARRAGSHKRTNARSPFRFTPIASRTARAALSVSAAMASAPASFATAVRCAGVTAAARGDDETPGSTAAPGGVAGDTISVASPKRAGATSSSG